MEDPNLTTRDTLQAIHLIARDDTLLAYHTVTGDLVELQPKLYEALVCAKDEGLLRAEELYPKSSIAIEALLKRVGVGNDEADHSPQPERKTNKQHIGRITLHVANDCNLRCKYCYAQGGSYGKAKSLMSPQTARDVVEFLCERFDRINTILFFGGEPLLNPEVIEQVCLDLKARAEKGQLEAVPRFALITNGTVLNDAVVQLIRSHISLVTVSVDGPQALHDANRVDAAGKGSWERVDRFIRTLKEIPDLFVKFESTITNAHVEAGCSARDIERYMLELYNITGTIANNLYDSNLTAAQPASALLGASEHEIYGYEMLELIPSVVLNQRRGMCPVGRGIVAIDTEGYLFPCHIVAGEQHLSLGSIYKENIFADREGYEARFPYLRSIGKTRGDCPNCWANRLCGGCVVQWFYQRDRRSFEEFPRPDKCARMRGLLERLLVGLAKARRDPERLQSLISHLTARMQPWADMPI